MLAGIHLKLGPLVGVLQLCFRVRHGVPGVFLRLVTLSRGLWGLSRHLRAPVNSKQEKHA